MRAALPTLLVAAIAGVAAASESRTDPDLGTVTWETRDHGVYFSMTQLLPDQLRAFFLSRGFDRAATERYATSCVFMTVVRNDRAGAPVHLDVGNWSHDDGDGARPPMTRLAWEQVWRDQDVSDTARLAFRWAQFPDRQLYRTGGDWNQGMLSVDRHDDRPFDITAAVEIAGIPVSLVLEGVTCAID